jgi:uncharacterized membrane protein
MPSRAYLIAALVALFVPGLAQAKALYRVVPVGVIPGFDASYSAALAPGPIVAGLCTTFGTSEPFFWTPRRGIVAAGRFAGARNIETRSVNALGWMVGGSDGNRGIRAWLWREGQGYTDLALVASLGISGASGINASGEVVGYGRAAFPFLWSESRGTVWLPGLPGTVGQGMAYAINDAGTVVGFLYDATGVGRPVAWRLGSPIDLGVPREFRSGEAVAISPGGRVAGNLLDGSQFPFAALYDPVRGWSPLGVLPGGNFSAATGVNDAGWVVGFGSSLRGGAGWLWRPDLGLRDLDDLLEPGSRAWTILRASGIDGAGRIAATAQRAGETTAVLLVPDLRPAVVPAVAAPTSP